MALTQEQYDEALRILDETSSSSQAHLTYPQEIIDYQNLAQVTQLTLTAAGFPFTVYQCVPEGIEPGAPLFVNIHSGGWYIPHVDNDRYFSCYLAHQIRGVVLSVDYTTSEKAPWDVMFEQCYETVRYAFRQAEALGCSPERISVGGYSAGGHLTAGVALRAAQTGEFRFKKEILCYAPLNMEEKAPETPENEFAARMRKRGKAFEDLLFRRDPAVRQNPYANPWIAPDEMLAALPETVVITAGQCGFRFEDEAYALRVAAQGVETTVRRFPEARHGFIPHFMDQWKEAAALMVKEITEEGTV